MFEKLFRFKGPKVEDILNEALSWNDNEISQLTDKYHLSRSPMMKGDILKAIQIKVNDLTKEISSVEVAA